MEPYHGTIPWNHMEAISQPSDTWKIMLAMHPDTPRRPCWPFWPHHSLGDWGRYVEHVMKKGGSAECEVFIERWLICCCESCESHWRCQRLPRGLLRQNTFLCRNWSKSPMKRKKDSLVITVVGCGRPVIASRTLWGASSVRQWKHFSSSRLHLRVVAAFYTPVGWWTVWGL